MKENLLVDYITHVIQVKHEEAATEAMYEPFDDVCQADAAFYHTLYQCPTPWKGRDDEGL